MSVTSTTTAHRPCCLRESELCREIVVFVYDYFTENKRLSQSNEVEIIEKFKREAAYIVSISHRSHVILFLLFTINNLFFLFDKNTLNRYQLLFPCAKVFSLKIIINVSFIGRNGLTWGNT